MPDISDTDVDRWDPPQDMVDDLVDAWHAEPDQLLDDFMRDLLRRWYAAGRLLPDGAEARTEWSIQWRNGSVQGGKLFTQAGAEQYAADLDATVVQRQVGPWVPVPSPTTEETPG